MRSLARPDSLAKAAVGAITAAELVGMAMAQGSYDVVDRQTAALIIWWAVGLGSLIAAPPRRPPWAGVAVSLFSAGIALWIALNVGSSLSQERTVNELARAVAHLGPILLIGWVLPARYWRSVLWGVAVGAVLVLAAALGNRLSPGFLGQTTAIVFQNTTQRLGSPLGYWNAVGSWAVLTTVLLLGISAHDPRKGVRALSLAFVPLATTVGYLTYSRSAVGAAVLGLAILLALSEHRWTIGIHALGAAIASAITIAVVRGAPEVANATGTAQGSDVLIAVVLAGVLLALIGIATAALRADRLRLPRRIAIAVIALTCVVGLAGTAVATNQYGQKAWDQFNTPLETATADPSSRLTSLNGTRMIQWRAAVDYWETDKVNGSGAGTFELTWNLRASNAEFVRDAHNAFIETLTEQGIIGLLILFGFVGSMIAVAIVAIRRAASALDRGLIAGAAAGLGAFIFGTSVDWFWELTALAMFAMILLSALVAAGKPDQPTTEVKRGWLWRTGFVLLAIVAILIELPGLVGTSEVRRSQRDVGNGNLTTARAHADEAIGILPWASSPFLQRGLVDERAGEWNSARRSLQLAIERDPHDWRLPLVLARIEAEAGRPKSAIAAYKQAKALRPNGQFFR